MATKTKGAAKTVAKKAGDKLSHATETSASGALIEPDLARESVVEHPAVDTNPREGVPPTSNQIDFNDPTLSDEEAVKRNLANTKAKK